MSLTEHTEMLRPLLWRVWFQVLVHLEPVSDSPWFPVAKWDLAQTVGETGRFGIETAVTVLLIILAGGALLGYFYRQRQARLYRTLYRAEREQHRLLEERQAILDSIGDGVIATNAESQITYLNPVAEMLTGYRGTEAQGRPLQQVFNIVDARSREPRLMPVAGVLAQGNTARLSNHTLLLARGGSEYPIADSAAPIRDVAGGVVGAVLVFRDVGERYRMEAALRASERRYRELFANAVNGVALHEALHDKIGRMVDFRYLDANPAFETHTGLAVAEVVGRRATDVFPGIEDTPFMEIYSRVLRSGEPASFERYFDQLNRHFLIHAYRVAEDQFATVFQDISERKRAEESLRDRHAELAQVFDTMPEAMVYTDAERRIARVNSAFVAIFGYEPEEVAGQKTAILYEQAADFRQQGAERYNPQVSARFEPYEVNYRRKNGEVFVGETVGAPIRDSQGNLLGMLGLIRDISRRKEAEAEKQRLEEQLAQSQKIESIGRLAGGVAHDFNNMLAVIMGNTELALRRLDPADPLVEDLHDIYEAARRSSTLTRQLLAFARKQTIAPRVINLNETVAGMLQMLERLIGEDIDLAWRPAPGIWPVNIDPAQVDQILANLCLNARDAIVGVGKITVETENVDFDEAYARTHPGFLPGEYVLLAVSDDGRGMDRETADHIFEPFFTTKERGEGTGLGLATVYGIVRQNGGFINVYSEVGQGTTFRIYFPRHIGPVEGPSPPPVPAVAAGGAETVLLVEDEPAILGVVQSLLETEGYTVMAADTPSAALSLVEAYDGQIDLLITDVVMPEMSGRELADRLSVLYPAAGCLFMSGYTANAIAHQGVLEEGVAFLQKPFAIEALLEKVRAVLEEGR